MGKTGEGSRRPTGTRGQCDKGAVHRRTVLPNKCAQVTGSKVPGEIHDLVNILWPFSKSTTYMHSYIESAI